MPIMGNNNDRLIGLLTTVFELIHLTQQHASDLEIAGEGVQLHLGGDGSVGEVAEGAVAAESRDVGRLVEAVRAEVHAVHVRRLCYLLRHHIRTQPLSPCLSVASGERSRDNLNIVVGYRAFTL